MAVFQASLKVVREEPGALLSKEIRNTQYPKDQIVYGKENTVNKNDALFLR